MALFCTFEQRSEFGQRLLHQFRGLADLELCDLPRLAIQRRRVQHERRQLFDGRHCFSAAVCITTLGDGGRRVRPTCEWGRWTAAAGPRPVWRCRRDSRATGPAIGCCVGGTGCESVCQKTAKTRERERYFCFSRRREKETRKKKTTRRKRRTGFQ